MLLLVLAVAQAQDDAPAEGDAAEGDAAGGDAAGAEGKSAEDGDGDEEAWQYVEFLKGEVK